MTVFHQNSSFIILMYPVSVAVIVVVSARVVLRDSCVAVSHVYEALVLLDTGNVIFGVSVRHLNNFSRT